MTLSASPVAALFLPPHKRHSHENFDIVAQFIALSSTAMNIFFDLRDFNERSSPHSLEGNWLKSLLEVSINEDVSDASLSFIDNLVLAARANQTISTEFLNENSYLYNRYDFDDAIAIENESVEAFKLYFKGLNPQKPKEGYLVRLQFPTRWIVDIRNMSTIEEKTQKIKNFMLNYQATDFSNPKEGVGFYLQLETMNTRIDLPVIKDVVSVFNIEQKDLSYVAAMLEAMRYDVEKLEQITNTPSFSTYEKNRIIVPQIIQTTGYSLLTRPTTIHALALDNIMAQRKVMEILKKSKYTGLN